MTKTQRLNHRASKPSIRVHGASQLGETYVLVFAMRDMDRAWPK